MLLTILKNLPVRSEGKKLENQINLDTDLHR